MDSNVSEVSPKDFHHPFQPYDIQQEFMQAMYDCIEQGKVGIFESPTGTGKSLSLLCSSLTWLREHKRKLYDETIAEEGADDDEPAWMTEHARESKRLEMRQMRAEFEARLRAIREREQKVRQRNAHGEPLAKRRRREADEASNGDVDDDQYVLDDYDSEDDAKGTASAPGLYSTETSKLMEQLGMLRLPQQDDSTDIEIEESKVYFCSRTHSQLSQFVGELNRIRLPAGLPKEPNEHSPEDGEDTFEPLKQLSLGSRKNLCINQKVAKLGNQTAINERCMELQQASTPATHKCPYVPNKENQNLVMDFRDHALARVRDIEDLAGVGARLGICPYYASRPAIGPAEIVTLPYPLLLQKPARDALGISLKDHIVIIDEAHNLMAAIEGIYSTRINEVQLKRARECLMIYLQKFRNRLKGSNRVYVTQVVRVVDSMLLFCADTASRQTTAGTLDAEDLMSGKGVNQVNLLKLVRYISESRLTRKVEGYVTSTAKQETGKTGQAQRTEATSDVPVLMHVQNFLSTLMNPSTEGRFFWSSEASSCTIQYMLLDPSEHFRDIVNEARAIILAGGTMSPMDDYRQQLFPYLPALTTFSCGHLVPSSSLLVRTIAEDSDGRLEFSYKSRNAASAARIGRALLAIAPHVRGGLVVFFPSYGFLDQVTSCWQREGTDTKLVTVKPVFSDSRLVPAETTFKAYSEAIRTGQRGAILLSVIGGKLSEGINFADDLGRCVFVVGLPFPNLGTPEWKAKMEYIDEKAMARGVPKGKAGREHVENVCMRAVNQAIGRVIRHKDDWASIVLMDRRYADVRIQGRLPGWIKESVKADASTLVEDVVRDIDGFFRSRRP